MTKKLLILGLLFTLVFTLNGCYSDDPSPLNSTATEVPSSSFSESTEDYSKGTLESNVSETLQSQEAVTSAQEETEYSKDIAETATTTVPTKTEIPKNDGAEKVNKPERQPEKQQNEEIKAPTNSQPTEPKPSSSPKQEEKPTEPQKPPIIEPAKEPEFDIGYWTSFTKEYAQSIGLSLDSSATECWDNPITANPKRTNLKDDIVGRLNRYKNSEGFTSVWIWAEKVSDTEYEIYIGYA